MVKPKERNQRYVDAVMTLPKGTLYPMCGMNLAFDRLTGENEVVHASARIYPCIAGNFCDVLLGGQSMSVFVGMSLFVASTNTLPC